MAAAACHQYLSPVTAIVSIIQDFRAFIRFHNSFAFMLAN